MLGKSRSQYDVSPSDEGKSNTVKKLAFLSSCCSLKKANMTMFSLLCYCNLKVTEMGKLGNVRICSVLL